MLLLLAAAGAALKPSPAYLAVGGTCLGIFGALLITSVHENGDTPSHFRRDGNSDRSEALGVFHSSEIRQFSNGGSNEDVTLFQVVDPPPPPPNPPPSLKMPKFPGKSRFPPPPPPTVTLLS